MSNRSCQLGILPMKPRPKVTDTINSVLRHGTILELPEFGRNSDFGSSGGESDETASDCLSVTETRSETSIDDVGSTVSTNSGYEYDHMMKFHCKELQFNGHGKNPDDQVDVEDLLGQNPQTSPIVSRKGSMRGVRGRVRAAIATFKETDNPHKKVWFQTNPTFLSRFP